MFRLLGVGLAVARIVPARHTIGPDPRAYMELAQAILRHDWAMVPNAYWSAFYPWLLAFALWVGKPGLRGEIPLAHALALPTYLACMAAFEFFWATLLRHRQFVARSSALDGICIPVPAMWALGYSLFIWMTIGELILLINPDLCVTAIALAAAGPLLRMQMEPKAGRLTYLWFGICLGVGYWIKAILFPMAFVFLGIMILVSGSSWRRKKKHFAVAALAFLMLAFPQIALLSRAKGRLTYSDTGKLNLAWFNYGLPYRNWQGQPPGSGKPLHPTRKLFDHPAVYEFNGPLRASYPPWFDPSYWNEGLSPGFDFQRAVRHMSSEMPKLAAELLHPTAWLAGMIGILAGCDLRKTWKGMAAYRAFLLIGLAACLLYSTTLIQSRFLPPWEAMLWGSFLAGARLRKVSPLSNWIAALVCAALIGAMIHLTYGSWRSAFSSDAHPEYATAEGLLGMGVAPGSNVGAIGFDNDAYWAYLARFNIIAEINTDETCLFWSEPPARQAQVLEKFREAGASVLVANTGGGVKTTSRSVPLDLAGCARPDMGWSRITGSPDRVFFLK